MLRTDHAPSILAGTIARARAVGRRHRVDTVSELIGSPQGRWDAIRPEILARIRLQNRFRTGLEIARYTAASLRRDIFAYDTDAALYTQSLGAWNGFVAQQHTIAIKRNGGSVERKFIHLSGWMVAALHSALGPLPGHSAHGRTATPELISEIYSRLKQADDRELEILFCAIEAARTAGDHDEAANLLAAAEKHKTHIVPVVADIDLSEEDADASYNLAKRMIEAGACALQIRQQISADKQHGFLFNENTAPDEDLMTKIRAVRYAFLKLGVEDGIIAIRAEALGAPEGERVSADEIPDDLGVGCHASSYSDEVIETEHEEVCRRDSFFPARPNPLHPEPANDRCMRQGIASLQNGADLLWIETQKPEVRQIADMIDGIRAVVPGAIVFFNNSPRFDWKLSFRQQVFDRWKREGNDIASYVRSKLMSKNVDGSALAIEADECIQAFQADVAKWTVFRNAQRSLS